MATLPPVPASNDPSIMSDWFTKLRALVNKAQNAIGWTSLNMAGSNLTDIITRNHNDLTSIQGGTTDEYYHITLAQSNKLGTLLSGITSTIALAKLTSGGTNGSMTVVNGIVTGYTAPT